MPCFLQINHLPPSPFQIQIDRDISCVHGFTQAFTIQRVELIMLIVKQ